MKAPDYSWQGRCVDAILTAVAAGARDFLVNATPGAGKTQMSVKATTLMMAAGTIDFVVLIAPTGTICEQFADEMIQAGVVMSRRVDGDAFRRMKAEGIGERVRGLCMTTAMLMNNADEVAVMTERYKVLFIADEAHHNGTGLDWGDAAIVASQKAVLRLALSGTPYREDDREIPFLHYNENGIGVPHFEFTHAEARAAHLITPIYFRSVGGYVDVIDQEVDDAPVRYTFGDEMTEDNTARRLRYAVDVNSPYVGMLIEEADEELHKVQATQPGAAGIVFANTAKQAKKIAKFLRKELGRKVRLVVESADASIEVAAFNESREDWIVQIRKVYEGANIPRLRVGAYLTNISTEGFFDQASKRLVRRLEGVDPDDMPAIMFMPADKRLEDIAAGLGEVKHHKPDEKKERKPWTRDSKKDDTTAGPPRDFVIVGGTGYLTSAIIDGVVYTADQIAEAEAFFASDPLLARQPAITKVLFFTMMQRKGVA